MSAKRVLVVDDEAMARAALAELLSEEGYVVDTAEDGLRALPKLAGFEPDIVITDYRMPGLDGVGLLRKALEMHPKLPVIVMSANDMVDGKNFAEMVRRIGAVGLHIKPLNFDELLLTIKHAIARRE